MRCNGIMYYGYWTLRLYNTVFKDMILLDDDSPQAHLPTSHSLTPPFLTYETSNSPPPSPGPSSVTLARSSFSFFLSAFLFDLSASVSKSSSNPLAARLALRSAFSISFSVGEGVRRRRTFGISRGSSYRPGDLFRGYTALVVHRS